MVRGKPRMRSGVGRGHQTDQNVLRPPEKRQDPCMHYDTHQKKFESFDVHEADLDFAVERFGRQLPRESL